jgi:AcrR family transcriptional regulator
MEEKRKQRRERQHAAVRDEIKAMARTHMARDGAAALSLRAVASDMGLSSAAIYYYYPNRDALITDLIVDGFQALGDALRAADPGERDIAERLRRVMLSYRDWAIARPSEYALLFGTPIPGYQGPAEITAPVVRRALAVVGELFAIAQQQGRLTIDESHTSAGVRAHAEAWLNLSGQPIPLGVLLATMRAWAIGHGLIGLEIDHHIQPIIGDPAAHFAAEVDALLAQLGVARR